MSRSFSNLRIGLFYLQLVFVAYCNLVWSFLPTVAIQFGFSAYGSPPVRKLDLVFSTYGSPTVSKKASIVSTDDASLLGTSFLSGCPKGPKIENIQDLEFFKRD